MEYKLKFEISIYDNENDLIERYIVDTEEERNGVLQKYYIKDDEAYYCDVEKIQTEISRFNKSK